MIRNWMMASAAALAVLAVPHAHAAPLVGEIDTFQNLTTENWVINLLGLGAPPPASLPTNIANGGPAGAGDAYLQLASTGLSGAGGKLVAINVTQWAGDYLAAGLTGVAMDLNNLGPSDLSLRLEFGGPLGQFGPENIAVSSSALVLPSGGGWTRAFFPIATGDLTAVTGTVSGALSGAFELRIFHNPSLGSSTAALPVAAVLGVDNITAVPEPASWLLLAGGIAALASARARRIRKAA